MAVKVQGSGVLVVSAAGEPVVKNAFEEALQKLQGLVGKFPAAHWKDPTSMRLRIWCSKVLQPKCLMNDTAFGAYYEKRWKNLCKILENPFQPGVMVQNPLLDRVWLLDESDLKNFLGGLSPFDGKKIEARVHDFAKAILQVVEPLLKVVPHEDKQLFAKRSSLEQQLLVDNYKLKLSGWQERQSMRQIVEKFGQMKQKMEMALQTGMQAAKAKQEALTAQTIASLAQLEDSQKQRFDAVVKQNEALGQTNKEMQGAVSAVKEFAADLQKGHEAQQRLIMDQNGLIARLWQQVADKGKCVIS